MSGSTGDDVSTVGVVELREDIPLKPSAQHSGGIGKYFGGIRFIVGCFGVLTIAITIALATQIYYGDYELVPHGSVASDAAECSRAGTDALKAGGGALDAAVAAALCLAVVAPHITGLDAGGALMLYEYRTARAQGPLIADWSGATIRSGATPPRVTRLVAALATLHMHYGKLPWEQLVAPAAILASKFTVSQSLAVATQQTKAATIFGALEAGQTHELPLLAAYLNLIKNKTTEELSVTAADGIPMTSSQAMRAELGGYVLFTPPAQPAATALVAALRQLLGYNYGSRTMEVDDELVLQTASSLQQAIRAGAAGAAVAGGVATNIAVIDKDDVYVSLVTGLSSPFGSHVLAPGGYISDAAAVPGLMPIMLSENYTCGHRYVLGSSDVSALTQVVANLVATNHDLISSVEGPRFKILPDSTVGIEVHHQQRVFSSTAIQYLRTVGTLSNATEPYASCNVVQQQADALTSHADSRGGGIAYRF